MVIATKNSEAIESTGLLLKYRMAIKRITGINKNIGIVNSSITNWIPSKSTRLCAKLDITTKYNRTVTAATKQNRISFIGIV